MRTWTSQPPPCGPGGMRVASASKGSGTRVLVIALPRTSALQAANLLYTAQLAVCAVRRAGCAALHRRQQRRPHAVVPCDARRHLPAHVARPERQRAARLWRRAAREMVLAVDPRL
eukprot:354119-Chlamydomonas_euryale.AAC.4